MKAAPVAASNFAGCLMLPMRTPSKVVSSHPVLQGANTVHILKTRGLDTSISVSALLVGVWARSRGTASCVAH